MWPRRFFVKLYNILIYRPNDAARPPPLAALRHHRLIPVYQLRPCRPEAPNVLPPGAAAEEPVLHCLLAQHMRNNARRCEIDMHNWINVRDAPHELPVAVVRDVVVVPHDCALVRIGVLQRPLARELQNQIKHVAGNDFKISV